MPWFCGLVCCSYAQFQACDDSIFAELSPSLRREVLWYINQKLIATVPFLRHAEAGFVKCVSAGLTVFHHPLTTRRGVRHSPQLCHHKAPTGALYR